MCIIIAFVMVELCPNYKFETKVKIFILNPRDGEHIERQGRCDVLLESVFTFFFFFFSITLFSSFNLIVFQLFN